MATTMDSTTMTLIARKIFDGIRRYLQARCEKPCLDGKTKTISFEPTTEVDILLRNVHTGAWLRLRFNDQERCVWLRNSDGVMDYLLFEMEGDLMKLRNGKTHELVFPDEAADEFLRRVAGTE